MEKKYKILAVLVNFGKGQLCYLDKIIEELKSFDSDKYIIDISVISNIHINRDDVDVVVYNEPPEIGQRLYPKHLQHQWYYLPFECRKIIYKNRDNYDLFLYNENDILYTQNNIDSFLKATEILPQNNIAGFIRYENTHEGNKFYPESHANYDWDFKSSFKIGDYIFAKFTNIHQGGFLVTKKQLDIAILNAGESFTDISKRNSKYGIRERASTDLYDTYFERVIPISHFDDFLIHHMPNRYFKMSEQFCSGKMELGLNRILNQYKN